MKTAACVAALVGFWIAWLIAGCSRQDEQAIAAIKAEAQQWRSKYEELVKSNEAFYQEVANLRKQKEDAEAERERLKAQLASAQEAVEKKLAEARAEGRAAAALRPPPEDDSAAARLRQAREALEMLGLLLFDQGQYELAAAVLRPVCLLGPDTADVCYQIAYSAAATGDSASAREFYQRAIAAAQKAPDEKRDLLKKCFNNYGAVLHRLGDFQKAEEAYRNAIALDPAFPAPYYNLGLLYTQMKDRVQEASDAFRLHIANGGERSVTARELMLKLAAPEQTAPNPLPAPSAQ